jgi:SIT family siderophore-iron:H+ symporter-like MFS transporter
VITSLFFASNNIGAALGNTIAGAIWNQVLPSQLAVNLGNTTEALAVFADPFTYATIYEPGTHQRDAIVVSYGYVQKLICIVGICLCIPQIAFACIIRNPKLGKEQSLPDAEEYDMEGPESEMKQPWYIRFFN